MGTGPFVDDLPTNKWRFSKAMLNCQRVNLILSPFHSHDIPLVVG
jgi:hypothetical protein